MQLRIILVLGMWDSPNHHVPTKNLYFMGCIINEYDINACLSLCLFLHFEFAQRTFLSTSKDVFSLQEIPYTENKLIIN